MKKILILKANQSNDYWYEPREVGYPRLLSYDYLDEAAASLPIAGVGVYVDRHHEGRLEPHSRQEPAYLRITNIRKDGVGRPHIRVEPLARMTGVSSADLDRLLGAERWIAPIARDVWGEAEHKLGLTPPREWLYLFESSGSGPERKQWLGPHFARLLEPEVDYAAVQEVVGDTLTALGLDVTSLNPVESDELEPDGFACTPPGERFGYWFVYDCKSVPFHLTAEATIRVRNYIARHGSDLPAQKAVPATPARFLFIAPSYVNEPDCQRNMLELEQRTGAHGCFLTFQALLAFLTARLQRGYRFTLAEFEQVFKHNTIVDSGAVRAIFPDCQ